MLAQILDLKPVEIFILSKTYCLQLEAMRRLLKLIILGIKFVILIEKSSFCLKNYKKIRKF